MRTIFLDENQTIYRLFSENRLVPRNGINNKDWNYNVEKVSEKALSACYNIWKRRYPQDIIPPSFSKLEYISIPRLMQTNVADTVLARIVFNFTFDAFSWRFFVVLDSAGQLMVLWVRGRVALSTPGHKRIPLNFSLEALHTGGRLISARSTEWLKWRDL